MTSKLTVLEQSVLEKAFFANQKTKAIAALLFSVVVISFVPILVKFAENEISPKAIIFHRLWIASAILGLLQILLANGNKGAGDRVWDMGSGSKSMEIQTPPNCEHSLNGGGLNNFLLSPPNPTFPLPEIPNHLPTDNNHGLVSGSLATKPLPSSTVRLLLITGIFFASLQILWAFSLTQTSLANSALLHNFTPLFVTVIGFLLFGQRCDRKFVFGMIIAISGSVILALDDLLYGSSKVFGDGIALLSAFFFAIYLLLVERLRNQLDAITALVYLSIIGSLAILPFLCTSKESIFPCSWSGWLAVVGLAWTVVLGFSSLLYALKWLSSGFVAMVLLIEPILTAIFAWVIFSERLDLYNLLAFPIVMLGVYLATTSELATKEKLSSQ